MDSTHRFLVRLLPGSYRVSLLRGSEVVARADAMALEGEVSRVTLSAR